jgi:hypothetical protein
MNFIFEVVIFPHESGDLYGYFITDGIKAYEKMLFNRGIAEDFHFQNQSDIPEDIDENEWAHREKIWDDLLPGVGNLMENGMLFQIVKAENLFHYDYYNKISSAIERICQRLQRKNSRIHRNMWE